MGGDACNHHETKLEPGCQLGGSIEWRNFGSLDNAGVHSTFAVASSTAAEAQSVLVSSTAVREDQFFTNVPPLIWKGVRKIWTSLWNVNYFCNRFVSQNNCNIRITAAGLMTSCSETLACQVCRWGTCRSAGAGIFVAWCKAQGPKKSERASHVLLQYKYIYIYLFYI